MLQEGDGPAAPAQRWCIQEYEQAQEPQAQHQRNAEPVHGQKQGQEAATATTADHAPAPAAAAAAAALGHLHLALEHALGQVHGGEVPEEAAALALSLYEARMVRPTVPAAEGTRPGVYMDGWLRTA